MFVDEVQEEKWSGNEICCLNVDLVSSNESCMQVHLCKAGDMVNSNSVQKGAARCCFVGVALASDRYEQLLVSQGNSFRIARASRSEHQDGGAVA
jgi:hypothetical protein